MRFTIRAFDLDSLLYSVLERIEHFAMHRVNYDFFAQFLPVKVEYLDRVNCIVNGMIEENFIQSTRMFHLVIN